MSLERLEDDLTIAELTAAAGLLLVAALCARLTADRLQVRHPRLVEVDFDVETVPQQSDRDLDMHLREAREQLLAGLLVAAEVECRILLLEAPQSRRHLLLVALGLRRDGEAHHRLREVDVRRLDRHLVVDEHVAGDDVLQLRDGAEIADAQRLDGPVLLAVQEQDLSEPLFCMCPRVDERGVARDRPGQYAKAADPPRERVGDRLEHEHRLLRVAELDRRALLRRRRHALDEQVEQRRRAEILRGDTARHGIELVTRHGILQRLGDVLGRQLLALEVARHQVLVRLDDRVEQLLPVLLHLGLNLCRNLNGSAFLLTLRIQVCLHVQQVDDPGQLVLRPDGDVHRHALVRQLRAERLEHAEEIGTLPVEHVHDLDAGEPRLVRTLPVTRGLHLDSHHGAHREHSAFDHAQRRDRVALETRVARRVDQIDLPSLPLEVADRCREGHLPALLVVVPVTDGRP